MKLNYNEMKKLKRRMFDFFYIVAILKKVIQINLKNSKFSTFKYDFGVTPGD